MAISQRIATKKCMKRFHDDYESRSCWVVAFLAYVEGAFLHTWHASCIDKIHARKNGMVLALEKIVPKKLGTMLAWASFVAICERAQLDVQMRVFVLEYAYSANAYANENHSRLEMRIIRICK